MTAASSDFDPQQLWQARPTVHAPVTLAELQRRARRFHRQGRRRRIEGWSCMIFSAGCLALIWFIHPPGSNWMTHIGGMLILLGCLVSGWRWRTMNVVEPPQGDAAALAKAYRNNLIRLRDGRNNVFLRIYLPLLPGAGLFFAGALSRHNTLGLPEATDHLIVALIVAIFALVFLIGWLWNQRQADRLQRKIEEL
jgi:Flp pilus assembly protein TadB